MAVPILVAGIVLAIAGGVYGVPPMPVVWLAEVVTAFAEPPAHIEGRNGRPVGQMEHRGVQRHSVAASCRVGLWGLSEALLPLPPNVPFVLAALVGAIAWGLPLHPAPQILQATHGKWPLADLRWADAGTGFLAIAVPVHYWRKHQPFPCSGVKLSSLPATMRKQPVLLPLGAVVGLAAGLSASFFGQQQLVVVHRPMYDPTLTTFAVALLGTLAGLYVPWRRVALSGWRREAKAWAQWEPRWLAMKYDPPPVLVSHTEAGDLLLDTFAVAPNTVPADYTSKESKLAAAVGPGWKVAVLPAMNEVDGAPVPGQPHPNRFTVAQWLLSAIPDCSTATDPDIVTNWAWCAFQWALSSRGYGTPMPLAPASRISEKQSQRSAWLSKWAWPNGPSLTEIRPLVSELATEFRCEVLIDHRDDAVYFGALGDAEFASDSGFSQRLANIRSEDQWNNRWSSVLKRDANPPTIRHETYSEKTEASGVTVYRQGFMVRLGDDPSAYRGLEPKLATALDGARYVSVCSWPGKRPGERHPQAFAVYWAMSPLPSSPVTLEPSDAAQWILTGMVDRAFDASRLARPMLIKARCLTTGSPSIWKLQLRLHDGVVPADVRRQLGRMAESLGCPWVQVEGSSGAECDLYMGARPQDAHPINDKVAFALVALKWGQAWHDAKIIGTNGDLLRLTAHDRLETNPDVEVLDFALPPGVDPRMVKSSLPALGAARGYAFVTLRPSPDGPSSVRILASRQDPLPTTTSIDWELGASIDSVPFALGVDGTPVYFDTSENPHLLVAGLTGAGKSSCVATIVYGFLSAGADLYVVDPQKGAADFYWADPFTKAFATTLDDATYVLSKVYEEVTTRVSLNKIAAKAGDRSPEHRRILVVVDEFTSLINQAKVGSATGNVGADLERDKLVESNLARATIARLTGQIAREARAANVTLLLATQKLTRDMLDAGGISDIKTNLARLLLGKPGVADLQAALRAPFDVPPLPDEMPRGRGLWEPVTAAASVVQVLYAPAQELAEHLAERRRPVAKLGVPGEDESERAVAALVDVVDAGTIEVSLDDLLGGEPETEKDDPSQAVEPLVYVTSTESEQAVTASVDETDATLDELEPSVDGASELYHDALVLLDVDGALAPLGRPLTWGDWQVTGSGGHERSALVSPSLCAALSGLGGTLAWLTTWEAEAPSMFGYLFPGKDMEVLRRPYGVRGWWKLASLLTHLEHHPEVHRVVWFDDDLMSHSSLENERTNAEVATEALGRLGIAHLLISPLANVGVTPDDIGAARRFLFGQMEQPVDDRREAVQATPVDAELEQATAMPTESGIVSGHALELAPLPEWEPKAAKTKAERQRRGDARDIQEQAGRVVPKKTTDGSVAVGKPEVEQEVRPHIEWGDDLTWETDGVPGVPEREDWEVELDEMAVHPALKVEDDWEASLDTTVTQGPSAEDDWEMG